MNNDQQRALLVSMGYESDDDMEAILDATEQYPHPSPSASLEDKVRWVEFCKAIREDDFSVGDSFWLGDWKFEVVDPGADDWECPDPPCLICVNPDDKCEYGVPK